MRIYFNIIRRRMWFFCLSGAITVAGLIVFLVQGFNLGPDFKSGTLMQLQLNQPVVDSQVVKLFGQAGITIGDSDITSAGNNGQTAMVRLPYQLTSNQVTMVSNLEKKVFPQSSGYTTSIVDPYEAQIISHKAIWAVLIASAFIVVYVAIRFEYRFAVAGIIALLHDAFIVMSVFSIMRLQVDLLFVTAVLTIVGYSINDTIVIFDRIRENLKLTPPKNFEELEHLVDKSLWQTMSRSINTIITVLIAAVLLYLFGGTTIHSFTFALIIGLVSGGYSSIFIASPIWVAWKGREYRKLAAENTPA